MRHPKTVSISVVHQIISSYIRISYLVVREQNFGDLLIVYGTLNSLISQYKETFPADLRKRVQDLECKISPEFFTQYVDIIESHVNGTNWPPLKKNQHLQVASGISVAAGTQIITDDDTENILEFEILSMLCVAQRNRFIDVRYVLFLLMCLLAVAN